VSSNVAFAKIGLAVGDKRLYRYMVNYGFGQKTGLRLPGEEAGLLKQLDKWSGRTLATTAMGHEISVTPIQLAMAYAAVANGGFLPTAKAIQGRVEADGRLDRGTRDEPPMRVIAPRTADLMRIMLDGAARYGTGRPAWLSPGVGGKTGTVQTGRTGRSGEPLNHAWFAGYAPSDRPRYVVVVLVEEGGAGGAVAAPIFRRIIESIYELECKKGSLP